MNKADRIVADRAKDAERRTAAREKNAEIEATERQKVWASNVQQTIDEILALLEAKGYPGARQIMVEKRTFFGGYKRVQRAAWHLGEYSHLSHGDRVSSSYFLLSDGKIHLGGSRDLESDTYLRNCMAEIESSLERFKLRLAGR